MTDMINFINRFKIVWYSKNGVTVLKQLNNSCPLYKFCTLSVYIWVDYYPVAVCSLSCLFASAVMVPILPSSAEFFIIVFVTWIIFKYDLPLFVKSILIMSLDFISTCTKYRFYFIVSLGIYLIKNTLYFYLTMLILLMVDRSVVVFQYLAYQDSNTWTNI